MGVFPRQCVLLAAICTVAFTLALLAEAPAFAQSDLPRLKTGSRLPPPVNPPSTLLVERLIITPHPARGGKLSAQLVNGQHGRLSAMAERPLSIERKLSGRSHLIRLDQPLPVDEARALAAKLRDSAEIESAEPDVLMHAQAIQPNDPGYLGAPGQWHYRAPSTANPGGADIPAAWDITLGSGNVDVAVLDTGYRPHVDLPAMLPGYDFISSTRISNDGSGRDSDARDPGDYVAANECGSGTPAARSSWHGTHVMGTIAALMNNGLYGTGVAPNARLLPVRVLGKCGGYTSDIVDGMRWAAGLAVPGVPRNAYPARIINLSLGSSGTCSAAFQSAVNDVNAAGAIVVVATGNGGYDSLNQPANCSGVLPVTAHTMDGDNADYANIGAQTLISAPGGGCGTLAYDCIVGHSTNGPVVYSLGNTGASTPSADTYALKRGTSMAAPHVSGTIALMLSLDPNMSRAEVMSILRASARPFPANSVCAIPGNEGLCGAGMLDAQAALSAVAPVVVLASPSQVVAPAASVPLDASAFSPGGRNIATYAWRASASNPSPVALLNANTPNASFIAPARGTYQFTLSVKDSHGAEGTASASVRVNSPPVVQAVAPRTVAAGKALRLTLRATDADANKPVFHAISLPTGATLSAAGVFNWSSAVPVGSHTVTVAASDADGSGPPVSFVVNVTGGAPATQPLGSSSGSGGGGAADAGLLAVAAGLLLVRRRWFAAQQ